MKRKIRPSVVAMFVLFVAQGALAADIKNAPGALCAVDNDANSSQVNGQLLASATTTITCPMVRDNATNTDGLDDLDVFLVNASGGAITCTAYSLDSYGNVTQSDPESTTSSGVNEHLNWGANLSSSSSGGTYVVVCTLAADDRLYTYIWDEP